MQILDGMDDQIKKDRLVQIWKNRNKSQMSDVEASRVKRRLQLALEMKDQQVSEYFNHLMLFNADPFLKGKYQAYKRMLRDKKNVSSLDKAPVFDRLTARLGPSLIRMN